MATVYIEVLSSGFLSFISQPADIDRYAAIAALIIELIIAAIADGNICRRFSPFRRLMISLSAPILRNTVVAVIDISAFAIALMTLRHAKEPNRADSQAGWLTR